ncbi:hypothetical protein RY831_02820 [Noviherbaspirillum sp. CPCC 100848]|uniref:Uncharacterized protein n=1 Tax=Noviherbaspirillum album TaxID=3080276 RepID=A0ABU6J383_9BURK|nr:hypothetical protein [Noviherbaspirillum sp. CPCC 100848]MEC4718069.1 hypothetical protein [Noviherbaspirillum sp. CPCC 100848]
MESIGECDASLALAMSNSGSLVERQRLLLLGMELDKRRLDHIGRGMHCRNDLDDSSCPQTARWQLETEREEK